ncbi:MAG: gliding motility-associated C-terminal domain-containing protein [Bacteroidetes bacterium]|nr:gliding motility-associated C-terminal domain-containing protein [Bacteroidota bacterium]
MKKIRFSFLLLCLLSLPLWLSAQCSVVATGDTTMCAGGMAHLGVNGSLLMIDYTWSPAYGLNATYLQYPVSHAEVTTTYYVSVTTLIDSELIVNGDFEQGNTGFTSDYTYNSVTLWNEGTYAIPTNPQSVHPNFSPCTDHTSGTGHMMVVNGASLANANIWCQTVHIQPNTNYAFSTWLASVHHTNPAILQFSINGVVLGIPFTALSSTCQWQQFYETWNSGTATTAQICIVNQNTALDGNDFALDDISFKPFCQAVDSVTVTISHVNADAGPETSVCTGDYVSLTASGGVGYHWDSGHNTQTVLLKPVTDTIYFVTVTDAFGCQGEDSVRVNLLPLPVVNAGPDQHICEGDIATLTVTPGVSYSWTNGATSQSTQVSPPLTSNYYVTVTDANGCHNYDSLFVWIWPKPDITVTNDTSICPDAIVTLNAGGGISYRWTPFETLSDSVGEQVTATPTDSITYTVTGTDENGCRNTAKVKIDMKECGVTIPNVFTPNNDGKNDLFAIDYKGRKSYTLKVFNRWGNLIFTSNDKNVLWDGTIHGTPCDDGVYYYLLMLDKDAYRGAVTVVR